MTYDDSAYDYEVDFDRGCNGPNTQESRQGRQEDSQTQQHTTLSVDVSAILAELSSSIESSSAADERKCISPVPKDKPTSIPACGSSPQGESPFRRESPRHDTLTSDSSAETTNRGTDCPQSSDREEEPVFHRPLWGDDTASDTSSTSSSETAAFNATHRDAVPCNSLNLHEERTEASTVGVSANRNENLSTETDGAQETLIEEDSYSADGFEDHHSSVALRVDQDVEGEAQPPDENIEEDVSTLSGPPKIKGTEEQQMPAALEQTRTSKVVKVTALVDRSVQAFGNDASVQANIIPPLMFGAQSPLDGPIEVFEGNDMLLTSAPSILASNRHSSSRSKAIRDAFAAQQAALLKDMVPGMGAKKKTTGDSAKLRRRLTYWEALMKVDPTLSMEEAKRIARHDAED